MERVAVSSGAIRSVGYDLASRTLEIEFQTGRIYQYDGVPPEVHAWLLRIDNKGGFLNRMIIDKFPAREVTQPSTPQVDLEDALRASLGPVEDATSGRDGPSDEPPASS